MVRAFLRIGVTACLLFVIAGCADRTGELPTEPPDFGSVPDNAAIQAQISTLLNQLFPQPERREANQLFAQVMRGMASGNVGSAQTNTLALIDLALLTELQDPPGPETTAEGTARLIRLLLEFVGAELLSGETLTVGSVGSDGGQVVTEDEFAGVDFPAGAVDENVVVTIREIDDQPCLPTSRPQRRGCYEFNTVPEVDGFNVDVFVGMCIDSSGLTEAHKDRFRLYSFDPDEGDVNVEALPNAFVDFVDCDDYVLALDSNALTRMARAAWKGVRRPLARWLGARPLLAVDLGLGGLAEDFSRLGWAGSSILVYGPSMAPPNALRPKNEQVFAEEEGHYVTVADAVGWEALLATGEGGFGDFDALVVGEIGSVEAGSPIHDTKGTWGPVVTGPVVVTAIHPYVHQCDPGAGCTIHKAEAAQLMRNALNYASIGSSTGLFVNMDRRFEFAPSPTSLAFLSPIGTFKAIGAQLANPTPPPVNFVLGDDVVNIVNAGHPVMNGLTSAGLSGWFLSAHLFFATVPNNFTVLARGGRFTDSSPTKTLQQLPVIVARP